MEELRKEFTQKVMEGDEFFDILIRFLDKIRDVHGTNSKGKQIGHLAVVCGSRIQQKLHEAFIKNGRNTDEAFKESTAIMELFYLGEHLM